MSHSKLPNLSVNLLFQSFRLFAGGASFPLPPAVMFTVGFERIDRLATKMAIGDPFEFWKFYVEAIGT
jgi:hypothetical protein